MDARRRLAQCDQNDMESVFGVMRELKELEEIRSSLAKLIGDRVIAPRK